MRDGGSKGEGMDRCDKNLVYQAIGKEEQVVRDELAKRWGSYDQMTRMRCVADNGITDYSSLKDCLERAVMEKSQNQNEARAATEAEANHKAYLDAIKEGNTAYSAGGFDKAIANFSEAIRHPDDTRMRAKATFTEP
jgi:hypothetical protein